MTKVRMTGSVVNSNNLADYGFLFCHADTMVKYGSVKASMLAGAIPIDNVISLKDSLLEENNLIYISTEFNRKQEYVYSTFAVNYDGLTCGEEQLFETDSLLIYKPLVDLNGKSTQTQWEAANWYFINKGGEGKDFVFSTNLKHNNANGYESTYKAGPRRYKRDNYMLLPGIMMGFDMKIDLLIYPLGTTKAGLKHSYAVVIATDSITEANCDDPSIVAVLDSMTFNYPGNQSEAPSDEELYVKRTINIPASYERQKVWIGIHHYNLTDDLAKSLFLEEFKLY
ncbi:MAG TPA: hypothetical protein PK552_07665, partial [Paludibacteraceae bacterium]|nr:hypothetical protein [Paludibacteraceae bacterium]